MLYGTAKQISSFQNPNIKQLLRLRDRSERDASGLFLIEGFRELSRAVQEGIFFQSLFICPELFLGCNELNLLTRFTVRPFQLTRPLFEKISYRDRPDGLIGVGKQAKLTLNDLDVSKKNRSVYVIAESIEKPGNLGTILRSCDAAGVEAVIVCDRRTDIHNPNVVRASVGTLFTIPVIETSREKAYHWIKENQIRLVITSPSGTVSHIQAPLKNGPLAIAFGTEQLGLSSLWINNADLKIKIPMKGVADSLNVAVSVAVVLYEVMRQRDSCDVE